ncbi:hypothetical protein J6590_036975 [Homalodisca vitripennis]|nr:hypothetical protein J6590_036975 [Homalodisca vitripennis]
MLKPVLRQRCAVKDPINRKQRRKCPRLTMYNSSLDQDVEASSEAEMCGQGSYKQKTAEENVPRCAVKDPINRKQRRKCPRLTMYNSSLDQDVEASSEAEMCGQGSYKQKTAEENVPV